MSRLFHRLLSNRSAPVQETGSDSDLDEAVYLASLIMSDNAVALHSFLTNLDHERRLRICNSRTLCTCPPLFMAGTPDVFAELLSNGGCDVHLQDTFSLNTILHQLAGAEQGTRDFDNLICCVRHRFGTIRVFSVRNNLRQSILDRALERSIVTGDPAAFFALCDAADPTELEQWIAANPDWFDTLSAAFDLTDEDTERHDMQTDTFCGTEIVPARAIPRNR